MMMSGSSVLKSVIIPTSPDSLPKEERVKEERLKRKDDYQ